MTSDQKTVLIIGAGPAGLTAALELIRHSNLRPVIIEGSNEIGGISRTVNYKGYRMDIGGHRFFSKSDWVMNWWQEILPIQHSDSSPVQVSYQAAQRDVVPTTSGSDSDNVMLIRDRLSRIYYLRRFFDYPIRLSAQTLTNLGPIRVARIGVSYLRAMLFPRSPERSLEDFLINRFGKELYLTFFADYTEKVWGVPCGQISAEWGAQRIKGLSILKAIRHALGKTFKASSLTQKDTNTSLIEHFLYPKLGPGQLWEEVAQRIVAGGGEIHFDTRATGIHQENGRVTSVSVTDRSTGQQRTLQGDFVISTMPIKDLVAGITPPPPREVASVAAQLPYRDFITVGLLLREMKRNPQSLSESANQRPPDNWIYVQESDVRLGRIQVFNNWSPYLVADASNIWLGLEYFCQEGDDLWQRDDAAMTALAVEELERIGLIDRTALLDSHVVRVPKTYPAYFGAYTNFDRVRAYLDAIPNLFLVGRNGMHRYNNQDHSMLTAKLAVDAIIAGSTDKDAIWAVNIDDDYHEEKPA